MQLVAHQCADKCSALFHACVFVLDDGVSTVIAALDDSQPYEDELPCTQPLDGPDHTTVLKKLFHAPLPSVRSAQPDLLAYLNSK
jgi:hypothetical protein